MRRFFNGVANNNFGQLKMSIFDHKDMLEALYDKDFAFKPDSLEIWVKDADRCIELTAYLQQKYPATKLRMIEGTTTDLFRFGEKVGQAEIDSKEIKSLRVDFCVMNEGKHNLDFLSTLVLKSAFLQRSSAHPVELSLNSETTFFTPNRVPVVGQSKFMSNLWYNFGVNKFLVEGFSNKLVLSFYSYNARCVAN